MIRLILSETDATLGHPSKVTYKTFDVELPEVEAWLGGSPHRAHRRIEGSEILPARVEAVRPEPAPISEAFFCDLLNTFPPNPALEETSQAFAAANPVEPVGLCGTCETVHQPPACEPPLMLADDDIPF